MGSGSTRTGERSERQHCDCSEQRIVSERRRVLKPATERALIACRFAFFFSFSPQALLSEGSEWSAISNLDAFFTKVYVYYVEKGFWCMIATRITNIMSVTQMREESGSMLPGICRSSHSLAGCLSACSTLAFTICFSSFLLLFVKWSSMFFCSSNESCEDILGLRSGVFSSPSTGDVVVFIYFALFCLYWLWHCFSFVYTLRDAMEMRAFYRDDLGINDVRRMKDTRRQQRTSQLESIS